MNSGYSAADIYSMQKEAEKRVFEMQRRARRTLELENEAEEKRTAENKNTNHFHSGYNPESNNFHREEHQANESSRSSSVSQEVESKAYDRHPTETPLSPGNLIDFLVQDKERALIALLLLILMREHADESVILLLLYLMMDV